MAEISKLNPSVQLNTQTKPVTSSETKVKENKKLEVKEPVQKVDNKLEKAKVDKANISEHGDTVELSKKKNIVDSKDGKVVAKETKANPEKVEKKPVIQEEKPKFELEQPKEKPVVQKKEPAEVNSFAGYTKSQVELLYRQGRISYNDYQTNLEQKEALLDEMKSDNTEISNKIVAYDQLMSNLTGRLPEDIQAVI